MAVQLMTVSAYAAGWDHDMYFSHEKRAIVFDFSEVRLQLPEEWEGKIAIEQTEKEIRFYHDASRATWLKSGKTDESENGLLFALGVAADYQLPEADSENWYGTVGSGTEGLYYLKRPIAMRVHGRRFYLGFVERNKLSDAVGYGRADRRNRYREDTIR